jgi:hypothetical protein
MADTGKKRSLTEGEKRTLREKVRDYIRRRFRGEQAPPPGDPYANVGAPLRRGPKGRSGAAVAEIEDDSYKSFLSRKQ